MRIKNPILKGFYPDPSICKVGSTYYMVHSSFNYFPGIPIFKSNDLCHWKLIGYALNRESQVNLDSLTQNQGIYASNIYFYDGIFYIISTNVGHGGNFVISTNDPEGEWSDPTFLPTDGIDPSLYFEGNKCYYIGTRACKNSRYMGDGEIYLCELNIETKQMISDPIVLWKGAFKDSVWQEGPHLYKRNDWYYLLISEGGTEYFHCLTIARSKNITGPYESNQANPILTHRHLGRNYPIANVGHADFIEVADNKWYLVCLGVRKYNQISLIGRETFLAKVTWEDDWPIVNEGLGKLAGELDIDLHFDNESQKSYYQSVQVQKLPCSSMFFLRNPVKLNYEVDEKHNLIKLKPCDQFFNSTRSPSFIGLRQTSYDFEFSANIDMKNLLSFQEAGLIILLNENKWITFSCKRMSEKNHFELFVNQNDNGINTVKNIDYHKEEIQIKIALNNLFLSFYYRTSETESWLLLLEGVSINFLDIEKTMVFTGNVLGIYSFGKECAVNNWVSFSKVELFNQIED